jgi:tight adherence protein B
MIRRATCIAFAAAGVLALSAVASAAEELKAVVTKAPFPQRSLIVSLPTGMRVDASRVRVQENGEDVRGLTVLPADAAGGRRFGAVLAIDTSNSMRGEPIAAAMEAARAFVARLNPGQPLAILAFDSSPRPLLRFTADRAAMVAALAKTPKLSEGTRLYDGVVAATAMIRRAGINPGTIVLLTDGRDTGSKATLDDAARTVSVQRVRVFAIGMRSDVFEPEPLQTLADAANGAFVETGSARDLAAVYDSLGVRLASEYLLTYRSLARLGTEVDVRVTITGVEGTAGATYRAPSLADLATPPFHRSFAQQLWSSPASMLLAALLVSALTALAVLLVLRPGARTLRQRMAEFVSLAKGEPDKEERRKSQLSTNELLRRAEEPFHRVRGWTKFKEELEIAEVEMPALQIVLWTLLGTVVVMWLIATLTGVGIFAVFGLVVPWIVRSMLKRKLRKKREAFSEQLPDNLQVLASALRAGHSLIGALSVVVEESAEPSRSEFRRVIADEQLGVPLEDALSVVVYRMDNKDLEQVALVAALQRRTGSSAAEVIERVTETVRERFELRRLINTLTAQGRLSRWIVSLLPPALMVVITLINPNYLRPLFVTSGGRILLVIATFMVILGSLVIKKIVDIEV